MTSWCEVIMLIYGDKSTAQSCIVVSQLKPDQDLLYLTRSSRTDWYRQRRQYSLRFMPCDTHLVTLLRKVMN